MFDPGDWEDDSEEEPAAPPADLTVYPTDHDDDEPVLYLADGTPLYTWRPPFGFTRP